MKTFLCLLKYSNTGSHHMPEWRGSEILNAFAKIGLHDWCTSSVKKT